MLLNELLKAIQPVQVTGDSRIEITGVNIDSRLVEAGQLFMAMRGTQTSCVRETIVGSRRSGCSQTRMKSVRSHGSSRILRILFAASPFIDSGSQISTVL